jgi:hypothetical protein
MNFKSIKAVFFFVTFLIFKHGLALNVRFCGGQIAEIVRV